MPNIASVLKEEISRIARKEVRVETEALKKASGRYRSEIAALKRQVQQLLKIVEKTGKRSTVVSGPATDSRPKAVQRFIALHQDDSCSCRFLQWKRRFMAKSETLAVRDAQQLTNIGLTRR